MTPRLLLTSFLIAIAAGSAAAVAYFAMETDPTDLSAYGLTQVQWGKVEPELCSHGDRTGLRFSATDAEGQRVQGTLCRGLFGRPDVRLSEVPN